MPKKRKLTCDDCCDCCLYIVLEIDKPTSKGDYNDLFWKLLHKDVSIFIDHDNSWNVEFRSECSALNGQKRCTIYHDRPTICRKYSLDTCTKHSTGEYYKYKFNTPGSLKRYLTKKGINWKFKNVSK